MSGRAVAASTFGNGSLPIDYVGPPESFHSISYTKVLLGKFPHGTFAGKLAIVGASSPILQDLHTTPTSNGDDARARNLGATRPRRCSKGCRCETSPAGSTSCSMLILGAVVPLGSLRVRQWRSLLDAPQRSRSRSRSLSRSRSTTAGSLRSSTRLLALALGTLGTLAVLYVGETIERARVHDLFSRFVPADVVEQVVASAGDNLRLGAVERDCTVLFSDLRGFTSFSEKLPATTVIEVVNTLPQRDDRGDPRRRRHADRLHGRRHHGRVRRAARAARPRRSRARRRHRDDRRAPATRSTRGSPSRATTTAS